MEQKHIIISVIVLALIVIGMFAFTAMQKKEIENPTPQKDDTTEATPYDDITRINAKHYFIDGTHTIAGEILMPTPCDLLEWNVSVAESYPEQVTTHFSVVNHSEGCAQVVTPQRFIVSFDAHEDADISATFQDRRIELNLIPAAEGETPDEFELFLKG